MQTLRVKTIMSDFHKKYLKGRGILEDEQLLGFVVLDEELGVIAASTYDPNYVATESNPIKNWIVYTNQSGMRAFILDGKEDFKNFLQSNGANLQVSQ